MTETPADEVQLGPIDYVVLEYPDAHPSGEAMPHLIDLVENGVIRILDVAVVAKGEDGSVAALALEDLDTEALGIFAGAATGLLDDEDITAAGDIMTPGAVGVILVYENTWAAPFATALRKAGAQMIANGRIPVNALLAALENEENA